MVFFQSVSKWFKVIRIDSKLFKRDSNIKISDAAWDQVEKRGGKHGRVNMGDGNQDRLLLHHPMCMTFPDHPNCEESCQQTFTSFSGKIEIKDYESYTSCLWQIKLPPTRTIEIQFTGDFDLEYHYQCGYDRVHIFSGSIDGDNQRQGRFCGPKGSLSFSFDFWLSLTRIWWIPMGWFQA